MPFDENTKVHTHTGWMPQWLYNFVYYSNSIDESLSERKTHNSINVEG